MLREEAAKYVAKRAVLLQRVGAFWLDERVVTLDPESERFDKMCGDFPRRLLGVYTKGVTPEMVLDDISTFRTPAQKNAAFAAPDA